MRIVITPSDEYRKKCGNSGDASETREYTVNILPRTAFRGNILNKNSKRMLMKQLVD
jgi:hypothetical protein